LIENPSGPGRWRRDVRSIYRFEGDKLHLVLGVMDLDERPDSFDHLDTGPPFTHLVLRRKGTDKDPAADERKELEGTWKVVAMEHGGTRQAIDNRAKFVFVGSRIQSHLEGKLRWEADYTVDPTTSPHHIDFRVIASEGEGMKLGNVVRGLYTLDRGMLTLSAGQPDAPRPEKLGGTSQVPVIYFRREGDDRGPPAGTPPAPGTPGARLRQLQEARVKALQTQLEGQFERVKIGKDPLIHLLDAARELAEAELDIAETKEARVAAVEKLLKLLTDAEKQLIDLQQAGLQTIQGVAQATAARLKAEVELEKLKASK
jgi:uncharacterized protein (TIGR03067 family)